MHTDQSPLEERVHSSYERAVDRRSGRRSNHYSLKYDGRDAAKPYQKAVRTAKEAHRSYVFLVRNFAKNGYNKAVRRITKRQLNDAANGIADLAAGIKAKAKRLKKKSGGGGGSGKCDPAYPDVCIPSPPPDLDCGDIRHRNFRVVRHPDPHGFDNDRDGRGCES